MKYYVLAALLFVSCKPRGFNSGSTTLEAQVDSNGRPYVSDATFSGLGQNSNRRDFTEIESFWQASGLSQQDMARLVRVKQGGNSRPVWHRMARGRFAESFTLGGSSQSEELGVDKMPWDEESHKNRELAPLMLAIESRQFRAPTTPTERYEVEVGRDYFVDRYFDTDGFDLTKNRIIARARMRFDAPAKIRRTLLQGKIVSGFDEFGLKKAAKFDTRKDYGSDENYESLFEKLDKSMLTGINYASGDTSSAVEAIMKAFNFLKEKKLTTTFNNAEAMLLSPKAVIMSIRGRYHCGPASLSLLVQRNLEPLYSEIADALVKTQDPRKDAMLAKLTGLKERTGIAQALQGKVQGTVDELTAAFDTSMTKLEDLEKLEIIYDSANAMYHSFAKEVSTLADINPTIPRKIEFLGTVQRSIFWHRVNNALSVPIRLVPFLFIDTLDWIEAFTPWAFDDLSSEQRNFKAEVPADKPFMTAVSADVQIESGHERTILEVMNNSDPVRKEWAIRLFKQVNALQEFVAQNRGQQFLREAMDAGFRGVTWTRGTQAKGEQALGLVEKIPVARPYVFPKF